MLKKHIQHKFLSMLMTLCLVFAVGIPSFAAQAQPYGSINTNLKQLMIDLEQGPQKIVFSSKQAIGEGVYLLQSDLISTSSNKIVGYTAVATDNEMICPGVELIVNPDKYDPGFELANFAQGYFSTALPGINVKNLIAEMASVAIEAVDIRFMGYDPNQYVVENAYGLNLALNIMKTSGDTYTIFVYLNMPESTVTTNKCFSIADLRERLKFESLRQINSWFVYGDTTTETIRIEDSKWQLDWEIMSAIPGTSTYEINILNEKNQLVKKIPISLETNSIGSVILDGNGTYKIEGKAFKGNMYIYAMKVPNSSLNTEFVASTWALEDLKKAEKLSLVPNVLYSQDMKNAITREEFCELVVLLYEKYTGKTMDTVSTNPFIDTNNDQVLKAYKTGITTGLSSNMFGPNENITREQCAVMLMRLLKLINPDANYSVDNVKDFKDQSKISAYAVQAAKFLSFNEIMKGDSNGNFMPKAVTDSEKASGYGLTTRESAVIISLRTFNYLSVK